MWLAGTSSGPLFFVSLSKNRIILLLSEF